MILNHQHRFLFIHVPKAAGTTITRALSPLTTFRDLEIGGTKYGEAIQERFAARFDLRKHSTGKVLRGKCPGHVWRRFFVFAFVRDPYSRAYSVYRFLQRWTDGPHHQAVSAQSFPEFLASDDVRNDRIEIARPQTHWLHANGKLLGGIDFVGRVENFAEDFGFVLSVIHRHPTRWQAERHDNISTRAGEWREQMTPEAQALVEDLYAEDLDAWDYPRLTRAADAA